MAVLVSFSGLPGVGKTTIAKKLALLTDSTHLRVDSVKAALKRSTLQIHPAEDAGYLAIASIALDNLLLGNDVIADTVNPTAMTRKLWTDTASRGKSALVNVEVICESKDLHRHRIESRKSDVEGLVVPNWQKVTGRNFEEWQEDRLVADTSVSSPDECASKIMAEMAKTRDKVK